MTPKGESAPAIKPFRAGEHLLHMKSCREKRPVAAPGTQGVPKHTQPSSQELPHFPGILPRSVSSALIWDRGLCCPLSLTCFKLGLTSQMWFSPKDFGKLCWAHGSSPLGIPPSPTSLYFSRGIPWHCDPSWGKGNEKSGNGILKFPQPQ